jgi:hypothetical protein
LRLFTLGHLDSFDQSIIAPSPSFPHYAVRNGGAKEKVKPRGTILGELTMCGRYKRRSDKQKITETE